MAKKRISIVIEHHRYTWKTYDYDGLDGANQPITGPLSTSFPQSGLKFRGLHGRHGIEFPVTGTVESARYQNVRFGRSPFFLLFLCSTESRSGILFYLSNAVPGSCLLQLTLSPCRCQRPPFSLLGNICVL